MQKSLEFYCGVLGFEIQQSAGPADDIGWVLLRYGTVELMLNTQYEKHDRPQGFNPERNQYHTDTALYFGCSEIDKLYEELTNRGVNVTKPYTTGYGWKAIDTQDPDGYHLCFHWPVE
jgi:uncharacterized glyoxalase superfamily protein PhnB